MNIMNRIKWAVWVSVFFALDIASKLAAFRFLEPVGIHPVIPGFFNLSYATNPGIAFSLFATVDSPWKPAALAAIGLLAMGYMTWLVFRGEAQNRVLAIGLAMICGGILGNMLNRLVTGSVVDFLDFRILTYAWPTFNLADTFICVGGGLVLLRTLRPAQEQSPCPPAS